MKELLLSLLLVLYFAESARAIRCHQCNGWHGKFPTKDVPMTTTCDNRNNQCETPQFCVKIIDAMDPGASYVTYKSDCYYAPNIQVNPQNLSTINPRGCYPYQDGSAPVKKWWYCFCNDRDYCNASAQTSSLLLSSFLVLLFWH